MYQLTKDQHDAICFASHSHKARIIEQNGLFAIKTIRHDEVRHVSNFFPIDELIRRVEQLTTNTHLMWEQQDKLND